MFLPFSLAIILCDLIIHSAMHCFPSLYLLCIYYIFNSLLLWCVHKISYSFKSVLVWKLCDFSRIQKLYLFTCPHTLCFDVLIYIFSYCIFINKICSYNYFKYICPLNFYSWISGVFFFQHIEYISSHFLLPCKVSTEKSAVNRSSLVCDKLFLSCCFQDFLSVTFDSLSKCVLVWISLYLF